VLSVKGADTLNVCKYCSGYHSSHSRNGEKLNSGT